MPDNIQTVTATISSSNPAQFTIGGHTVDVYGTWTYQWDKTTGLLVNSPMTGSVTVKDTVTGVTTVFTDPVFNFSGAVGDIAEVYFASGTTTPADSGTSFNSLFLDWSTENPTTLYTGTQSASAGGAQYTSVKQSVTTRGGHTTTTTYHVNTNKGGTIGTVDTSCFAAGTHILTPNGEVLVEDLRVNDLVMDASGIAHPIKWLGYRTVKLSGEDADADRYLVRIKANAFADGVPHRDLLITGEHCVLVKGGLVPARTLVNGRSIITDRSISAFTYYHVELENHGILLAEGLQTESYLDTGNRGNFANAEIRALRPSLTVNAGHKSWADAAAPLVIHPWALEPVWNELNARALALFPNVAVAKPVLTDDADLRLVTETGAIIQPVRSHGSEVSFILPAGVQSVHLASRTARFSETVGPFMDDRRDLGVRVGQITLLNGTQAINIDAHLSTPALSGWFEQEGAERWTNGYAELPVDLTVLAGKTGLLKLQIVKAGPYLAAHAVVSAKAA